MSRAPLPDLVIGGAPRSGTTFLCEVFSKHPGCFVAQPFIPEPKVLMTPHPDGVEGYRRRYETCFENAAQGMLRVEKTSYYFENAEARERFALVLPDTKMVFILRDPIVRAYSNWRWSTRNGLESRPFDEAIALEEGRASPFQGDREYVRPFDYLARSNYGALTESWIAAIGQSRIGFFVLEEANADPERFVAQLQQFAGLAPLPWEALKTGIVNANDIVPGDIDPTTISELRVRFAPDMAKLANLTGLDIARWGY
jgi:Sulfotransferase domain